MTSKLKTQIGIFSLSMLSMSTLVLSPVIGALVDAFPDQSISKIQMVLSVATLTGMIAAFLGARLALSLTKKTIAVSGALITCVAGLIPYVVHSSLNLVIACSAVVGVGAGFVTNTIPGLIADNFSVEDRQTMMGRQVAFVSIGTMVIMYISGILGTSGWYYSSLTYLLAGLVAVIAYFTLPMDTVSNEAAGAPKPSFREALNSNVIIIACLGFIFMIVNNVFNNNLSLLIQETNLGGSDVAGLVNAVSQLGGLLAGFAIGRLAKMLRTQMVTLAFVVEGVALLLLAFSSNLFVAYVGSFLAGCGLSIFFSQAPFLVTISVMPILIPSGVAILSTLNSIGGFLSPTLVNAVTANMSSTAADAMLVGGILSLAVAIIVAVTNFQAKALKVLEK